MEKSTAVAVREPFVTTIDITKADRKALKYLERQAFRRDMMAFTESTIRSGADVTKSIIDAFAQHEILCYALGMIAVYNLMRLKLLDPVTAAGLNAGLATAIGFEAILPEWLT